MRADEIDPLERPRGSVHIQHGSHLRLDGRGSHIDYVAGARRVEGEREGVPGRSRSENSLAAERGDERHLVVPHVGHHFGGLVSGILGVEGDIKGAEILLDLPADLRSGLRSSGLSLLDEEIGEGRAGSVAVQESVIDRSSAAVRSERSPIDEDKDVRRTRGSRLGESAGAVDLRRAGGGTVALALRDARLERADLLRLLSSGVGGFTSSL